MVPVLPLNLRRGFDPQTGSHSAAPPCSGAPAAPPQTKDAANHNVSMGVSEKGVRTIFRFIF